MSWKVTESLPSWLSLQIICSKGGTVILGESHCLPNFILIFFLLYWLLWSAELHSDLQYLSLLFKIISIVCVSFHSLFIILKQCFFNVSSKINLKSLGLSWVYNNKKITIHIKRFNSNILINKMFFLQPCTLQVKIIFIIFSIKNTTWFLFFFLSWIKLRS